MKDTDQIGVGALFLDYDGTITSLNVPRQESRVPAELNVLLHRIKELIPVGIITTKDMGFIVPKTRFANVWAAIAGLEIRIGSRVVKAVGVKKRLPYVLQALEYARRLSDKYLFIEEKRDSSGQTVAFCVDWRFSANLMEAKLRATRVMNHCRNSSLEVIGYEGQPYFDVYPCRVDKGKALVELKRHFGLQSGLMYLGDSKVDNPAFQVADIGIGVLHEESAADLECDYYVRFEDVGSLLRRLMENNLVFYDDSPEIIPRKQ